MAGASLSIDYVLTVAVSVAAGIAALTSYFPVLENYRVLLCLGNRPDQADLEVAAIDACRAAGVRRVVKISAKGAQPGSPVPFWDQHARIEDHLWRSGMAAAGSRRVRGRSSPLERP